MLALPDANNRLHNILRALSPGFDDLRTQIEPSINACKTFIKLLTVEYRDNYIDISRLQSLNEAINKARRTAHANSQSKGEPEVSEFAWAKIQTLEHYQILCHDYPTMDYPDEPGKDRYAEYEAAFVSHVDTASRILRAQLDASEKAKTVKPARSANAKT